MSTKLLSKVDGGLGGAATALPALLPLLLVHDRLRARLRAGGDPEAGASLVEWVLITAVVAVAVTSIGALIVNKLRTKANTLDLKTP